MTATALPQFVSLQADEPPFWRRHLALIVLLAAMFCLRLWHLDGTLCDSDEWRQTDTASIARNFLTEPNLFYPRINWGAPGPGYVESELPLFPYAVHLLYRVFGPEPFFGRLLSALLTMLSGLAMYRIAGRLLKPGTALLTVLLFSSAPLVFHYSRALMPEATVMLFYLFAVERFLAYRHSERWGPLLAAAVCMACAILVKPTSIHLGLTLALVQWRDRGLKHVFSPQMLCFGLIALAPEVVWVVHAANLHSVYGNTFGVISGGDAKWGSFTWWLDPAFYSAIFHIDEAYAVGWAGLCLAVLGLLLRRTSAVVSLCAFWLATIFIYYLIVARYAGIESRGLQYHVYVTAPLSLAAAAGADALYEKIAGRFGRPVIAGLVTGALVMALLVQQWRSNMILVHQLGTDLFMRAGHELARVSQPDEFALVTSTDVALDHGVTNNFEEPKVLFHAWRKGRLLAADQLTAKNLKGTLAKVGARWVVVLDQVLVNAEPAFATELAARCEQVTQGEGFKIYRVRT